MAHKSNRAHPALASRALPVLICSTLLSPAAWAESVHVNAVHVNVPAVRVKPVIVRVKPTVHLPASAGLGQQHLSNGGTAPGRWHGPNKGETTNGSTTPASPGAAAYSVTIGKPPAGTTAGTEGAPAGGKVTYPGTASSTILEAVPGPPSVILDPSPPNSPVSILGGTLPSSGSSVVLDPVSSGVGSTQPSLPVVMLWSINIDVGVVGRLVAAETVFPGLPFVIIGSAAIPYIIGSSGGGSGPSTVNITVQQAQQESGAPPATNNDPNKPANNSSDNSNGGGPNGTQGAAIVGSGSVAQSAETPTGSPSGVASPPSGTDGPSTTTPDPGTSPDTDAGK